MGMLAWSFFLSDFVNEDGVLKGIRRKATSLIRQFDNYTPIISMTSNARPRTSFSRCSFHIPFLCCLGPRPPPCSPLPSQFMSSIPLFPSPLLLIIFCSTFPSPFFPYRPLSAASSPWPLADPETEDVDSYYQSGMNDILAKPFTKHGLFGILDKHLIHLKAIQLSMDVPRSIGLPPLSDQGIVDAISTTAQWAVGVGGEGGVRNPLGAMGWSDETYQLVLQVSPFLLSEQSTSLDLFILLRL